MVVEELQIVPTSALNHQTKSAYFLESRAIVLPPLRQTKKRKPSSNLVPRACLVLVSRIGQHKGHGHHQEMGHDHRAGHSQEGTATAALLDLNLLRMIVYALSGSSPGLLLLALSSRTAGS